MALLSSLGCSTVTIFFQSILAIFLFMSSKMGSYPMHNLRFIIFYVQVSYLMCNMEYGILQKFLLNFYRVKFQAN